MEDSLREEIALFCDVDVEAVVPLVTADTVYVVPLELEMAGLAHYVLSRARLCAGRGNRGGRSPGGMAGVGGTCAVPINRRSRLAW